MIVIGTVCVEPESENAVIGGRVSYEIVVPDEASFIVTPEQLEMILQQEAFLLMLRLYSTQTEGSIPVRVMPC